MPQLLTISSSTSAVRRSDLAAIDAEVGPCRLWILAHDFEPDRMPAGLKTLGRQDDASAADRPGCVEIEGVTQALADGIGESTICTLPNVFAPTPTRSVSEDSEIRPNSRRVPLRDQRRDVSKTMRMTIASQLCNTQRVRA